jgi:hypothetical protein
MTDPVFDKEGNLSNLDELDRDEVAVAYAEKNKQLFGRMSDAEAKLKQYEADKAKAEADLAAAKAATPAPAATVVPDTAAEREELRLIARGLSDEELSEAKDIAKGKGISLVEAMKTPLFQTFQAKFLEDKRSEAAKLPGSHGSGATPAATGIKSGMKKDEHEAAWKKTMGIEPEA